MVSNVCTSSPFIICTTHKLLHNMVLELFVQWFKLFLDLSPQPTQWENSWSKSPISIYFHSLPGTVQGPQDWKVQRKWGGPRFLPHWNCYLTVPLLRTAFCHGTLILPHHQGQLMQWPAEIKEVLFLCLPNGHHLNRIDSDGCPQAVASRIALSQMLSRQSSLWAVNFFFFFLISMLQ